MLGLYGKFTKAHKETLPLPLWVAANLEAALHEASADTPTEEAMILVYLILLIQ